MDVKDAIWELESAEARLSDDIDFLHTIQCEYFEFKEPKESLVYLYQQLNAAVTTITKSMELNQIKMQNVLNNYYKEIKQKEGEK